MSTLSPPELEEISRLTTGHYGSRAESFWEGTRDHDVSQNITALLSAIDAEAPLQILESGLRARPTLRPSRTQDITLSGSMAP